MAAAKDGSSAGVRESEPADSGSATADGSFRLLWPSCVMPTGTPISPMLWNKALACCFAATWLILALSRRRVEAQ
jgi:hypothetical protein